MEETAKHEVVMILRAPDGRAVLSEDTNEEAVVPFTSSESLNIMLEPNQDNAQRVLSEEIHKDWDKEAAKVMEKTPSTAREELHRKSDSPDARQTSGDGPERPPPTS